MFWDTKDPPSYNIEILLESPGTKVEVFLEEENIIQECKTLKKNIVKYFTRRDVVRRMIELITTEPPEEVPITERFRHANVACEILTMGLPSLDEKLLTDTDALNMLYSYLENEPPLNPLLASFFSKTFSMLFTKKSDQDWFLYQQNCLQLLEYLKRKSNFLDMICKHFSTPIVPDLIMEMMRNVEGAQLKKSLFEWLKEQRLVEKLIEIIGDFEQCEKHANVADFLCDLIHQGRAMRHDIDTFEPVFEGSDPILTKIESATTLLALFNVILQPNFVESAIVSGIAVVLTIIKPAKVADDRNTDQMLCYQAREDEIHNEFLTTVIRVIEPQIKQFNELLKNPPKKPDIFTSAAKLSPPFGMARLQIIRLFAELLKTKNDEISKAICETDFLDILISLFKEYCWNNFLHGEAEKCIHSIFPYSSDPFKISNQEAGGTNDNKDTESKTSTNANTPENSLDDTVSSVPDSIDFEVKQTPQTTPSIIQNHAIVNCKIISKLLECWKTNKELECDGKGRRLGYMGHLINIFKHITGCMAESKHIGDLIESNLKDDNERDLWQSIVNEEDGELVKLLTTQSKLLANHGTNEPLDSNVPMECTQENCLNAFKDLCILMSGTVIDKNWLNFDDDDDGDGDDNATASSDAFYAESRVNPFAEDPWESSSDLDDMMREVFVNMKAEETVENEKGFADFPSIFSSNSSTLNINEPSNLAAGTTEVSTTSPDEYDNNANVEKSSLWSGDFTSFQIPKKDIQYTTNFIDDYEDDNGMWTKPLGASYLSMAAEKADHQSIESTNPTDECKINLISNGPSLLEQSEHGPDETTLNQLSNSIEDNTLIEKIENITLNENNQDITKEINNELNIKHNAEEEETTSKHKSNTTDTNAASEIENTDTTQQTAKAAEGTSDDSPTATATA